MWDGSKWNALGKGLNADVYAIAVDSSGIIYAGGNSYSFENVVWRTALAKWNGTKWEDVNINIRTKSGSGYIRQLRVIPEVSFISTGNLIISESNHVKILPDLKNIYMIRCDSD